MPSLLRPETRSRIGAPEPVASRPVRLAFLGCGGITAAHSRTLAAFRGRAELAYASRDAAKAEATRLRFAGAASYGTYEAAWEDPRTDAVIIATPPDSHRALAEAALRAGKHVIVEKPAFLCSTDCDAVRAVAQAHRRQVLVAENYAYKPLARTLRTLLAERAIGDPLVLTVNAMKTQRTGDWRDDVARAGGGALFEGGVHWIDLVANLGLTVESVQGFRPGSLEGPERNMVVVLQYEEGAVGTLYHAWDVPALFKGLRLSKIHGTRGSITFESNGLFVAVRGPRTRLLVPGLRDIRGVRAMWADFLDALVTAREPVMTLARARHALALVEAAYASVP